MLKQEGLREARTARVEAWGNVWRWGEHPKLPFTSSTSVEKISSHLDTNRRNKGLLIPSQLHPPAWHQLSARSLQLAACSRRPGHLGSRQRKGAQATSNIPNPEQDKPVYTYRRPDTGLASCPPSKNLSLCVSRDRL